MPDFTGKVIIVTGASTPSPAVTKRICEYRRISYSALSA
jgi:hypothetical protein